MKKLKEPINLGFCPVCKENFDGCMTRVVRGVVFDWLCSFNAEESYTVGQYVSWAKDYQKNMMPTVNQKETKEE
jgi:hypothetical protein